MPSCQDCGRGLGIRGALTRASLCDTCLDRRIREEVAQEARELAARRRLPALLNAVAADGVIDANEAARIQALMDEGNITAAQKAAAALAAYRDRYRAAIADGDVSDAEYDELINLQIALKIDPTELMDESLTIQRLRQLAAIDRGEMPTWPFGPSIILKKGEIAHIEAPAGIVEEKAFRERVGRSSGVSTRVAKGVYYHVQTSAPRTVTHLAPVTTDTGQLCVTNQRIAYVSPRKSFSIPHLKLLGLEMYSDAIRINAENRQKPINLQVADPQMLAAIIGKAASLAINA